MGKKRFCSGDEVLVISGNEKGKTGKILTFKDDKVIIEGINIRKKHMKPGQQNQKGQMIDIECPVHISNVMTSVDGKGVKLKTRFNKEGERELYYLDGGKEVFFRAANKPKS